MGAFSDRKIHVWRVEDPATGSHRGRLGQYTGRLASPEHSAWWQEHLRPAPWVDGIPKCLVRREGWVYGCQSKALLHSWFSPYDLFLIGLCGGVIRCYSIKEKGNLFRGGKQCVFFKSSATLVYEVSAFDCTFVKNLDECGLDEEYIQDLIDFEHLWDYQNKTGELCWDEEFPF